MDKLKLCPFCGGEAEWLEYDLVFWIGCSNCGCGTNAQHSEKEAITVWNRRFLPHSGKKYPMGAILKEVDNGG